MDGTRSVDGGGITMILSGYVALGGGLLEMRVSVWYIKYAIILAFRPFH